MNAGVSVSRVGGSAQTKIIKKLSGGIRTAAQLDHGRAVTELMKQKQYSPQSVGEMAVVVYAANEGYLNDVEEDKIGSFEASLLSYMNSSESALMDQMNTGAFSDEIQDGLKKAVDNFKATQTW